MLRLPAEVRRRGEALNMPQLRHGLHGLCGKMVFSDGLKPT